MFCRHLLNDIRQEAGVQRFHRDNADLAAPQTLQPIELAGCTLFILQYRDGVACQDFSGRRHLHAVVQPLEQRHANIFFEL